jgi:hypothetical protein
MDLSTWLALAAFAFGGAVGLTVGLLSRKDVRELEAALRDADARARNLACYAAELKRKLELSDDALSRERTRRDAALKDLDAMMLDGEWRGHGAPTRAVHKWVERLEQSLEKPPGMH